MQPGLLLLTALGARGYQLAPLLAGKAFDKPADAFTMMWDRTRVRVLQTGEPGPVGSGNPYCWINEECESEHVLTFTEQPRVTASFGYNASAPGGGVPRLATDAPFPTRESTYAYTSYFGLTAYYDVRTGNYALLATSAPANADGLFGTRGKWRAARELFAIASSA